MPTAALELMQTFNVAIHSDITSKKKKIGTPKGVRLSQKLQLTAALRIECPVNSNTFNLYYYGQENSLQLKLSVAGK